MKIAENTPARRVVVENPGFAVALLTIFLGAVSYALARDWAELGLGNRLLFFAFLISLPEALRYFVLFVRLEFDRAMGRVTIDRKGRLRKQRTIRPFGRFLRAPVDSQENKGKTHRAVLVFDEAVLDEIDPAERERLETLRRRGFRETAPNETPITYYFSGVGNVREIVDAINEWFEAGR